MAYRWSVAPEQYMTIAIPGNTIDVRDVKEGGTFVYGAEYSAFPPIAVRQAESRLVDYMCPLSHIMVRLSRRCSAVRNVADSYLAFWI